jgi:hypothetical protein
MDRRGCAECKKQQNHKNKMYKGVRSFRKTYIILIANALNKHEFCSQRRIFQYFPNMSSSFFSTIGRVKRRHADTFLLHVDE